MNTGFAINTGLQAALPEVDTTLPYYLTNAGRRYWVDPENRSIFRLGQYDEAIHAIVDFSHERAIFIVYLLGGGNGTPDSREEWFWEDSLVQQQPYRVHYTQDNLTYRVEPMDRHVTLEVGPGVPEERQWNFIPWVGTDQWSVMGQMHLRARDQVLLPPGSYTIR